MQKRICKAIRQGNYYQAAAASAGITYDSFRNWMKRGQKAKSGIFFDFFHAVKEAEAKAETSIVASWKSKIPKDYKAARDFLARRFPQRWAGKNTVEHTGKGGKPIQGNVKHDHNVSIPDPAAFAAFMADVDRAGVPDVHRNGFAKPVDTNGTLA